MGEVVYAPFRRYACVAVVDAGVSADLAASRCCAGGPRCPQRPVTDSRAGRSCETAHRPPGKRRARVDSRGAIDAAPCPLETSDVRVTLREVRYSAPGAGDIPAELRALLGGLQTGETGDQAISIVCRVRDRANDALRRAGYIASVQVPPQEIADGVLLLTVVRAHIVELRVRGEVGRFTKIVEGRLDAIKALDPLNVRDIERILLLAGDIPGLDMQLTLKPAGGAPGDVIGDVTVETRTALLLANVQNTGSRQIGREVASVRAEAYGLGMGGDRAYLTYSNTLQWREAHVLQAGYDVALGNSGLRVGTRVSAALSNPSIPNLDLRSRTLIGGFDVRLPLRRTVGSDVRASAGFEGIYQRTQIAGGTKVPFTADDLRILYARLDADFVGRRRDGNTLWALDATAEVRKGIDVFNASKRGRVRGGYRPSRLDGDPQALVLRGSVDATWAPVPALSITAGAFGQYSRSPLLNIEEFSLGNLTYGRGYDPGANGADATIAYRIEPRLHLPEVAGFRLELMGFYDAVKIFNRDPGTQEDNRLLRSIGGGVRLVKPGLFVLDVTYAKPLDLALSTDNARPTPRLLVSLTMQLVPWRAGR